MDICVNQDSNARTKVDNWTFEQNTTSRKQSIETQVEQLNPVAST